MTVGNAKEAQSARKGSSACKEFSTPDHRGTSCHINIYRQWRQAMMSQARFGLESGTDIVAEIFDSNSINAANDFKACNKQGNFAGRVSRDAGDFFPVEASGYYGKQGGLDTDQAARQSKVTMLVLRSRKTG
jgi:hypothetical protein